MGLVALLAASYFSRSWSPWDGLLPLGLALWALTPDFIYIAGPFHRDWMNVFLFHIALDEILPVAVTVLALLWVALLIGYASFRAQSCIRVAAPGSHAERMMEKGPRSG